MHPADGPGVDHLLGLDQARGEHFGLGVTVPDTGLLDGVEAGLGFLTRTAERLGADDALAGRRRRPHGLHVQVVRDGDEDQVHVVAGDEGVDASDGGGDVEALG